MKKLLIVVDYQNDFVTGTLGFSKAKLLETPILEKIKQYEASEDHIIYTFDTHHDEYLKTQEGLGLPIKHCIHETEGHALYGKVFDHYTRSEYPHVENIFKNSFGAADLLNLLVEKPRYQSIELIGLVSYVCVLTNALIAKTAQPEAQIIVDSKCTAGPNKALHDNCLMLMSQALQIVVA